MAKDVNIHVKAKGAHQAKGDIDKVADSTKKVGTGVERLGEKGKKTGGIFAKFTSGLTGWAVKLVGITAIITAITRAISAQKQALQEHAQIAGEQQKKLLELQYLGEFFKERPELRKEVAAYAEFGRKPFTEVAGAWYNLRSKAARLTPQQRQGILTEALELGRMYPEAPLDTLVDMFSLYAKQTKVTDINRIQNLLLQTITEAGGGMADVAKYMPQFLPIGLAGGLTGAQTAGLWAYVTTQLAEPSIATTGLKATFMGLQGKGGPEAQAILQQFGIGPGMNFMQKITALSGQYQAGQFGLAQAEQLAGREGAAVLLSMLKDPRAMMQTIANVVAADRGDRDITRSMITRLMGTDEVARLEERGRQLDIMIENIKGSDIDALKKNVYIKEYEKQMRELGLPEFLIDTQLFIEYLKGGVGAEPGGWSRWVTTPLGHKFAVPPPSTIINNHNINYNPRTGDDLRGPRVGRDIR